MVVRTIAVIGAGAVGREIAYATALAGYKTIVEDVVSSRMDQAIAWISQTLDVDVAQRRVEGSIRDAALANLSTASTVEDAVRESDLIIEAVAEEMEMKIELFTIFDKFAKPGAILASSSPALSIAELVSVTFCAERCIGMRFPAAVNGKNVLELICAPETSEDTVAACHEVELRMGKGIAVVREME